jgi:hypothetical protein
MVHERERLSLSLEAGEDLFRVSVGSKKLDRDLARERMPLLGEEDDTEGPFSDLLEEGVGPEGAAE